MMKISTFEHIGKRDYMQDVLGHDTDTFVVCDGLGWHDGSGKAAEIAVETILECKDDLDVGFNLADHRIVEFHDDRYGKPSTPYSPHASTTAVAVKVLDDNSVEWMSVGDSFIVHFHNDIVTVVNPLDEGSQGGLTNFLGIRAFVMNTTVPFHTGNMTIHKGDIVVLCSDGCEEFLRVSIRHAAKCVDMTFAESMGNFILGHQVSHQDNIAIIALQF